jgi:hypothetical protein
MIKCLLMDRVCALYDPQGVLEALGLPEGTAWIQATKAVPNHRYRRGPKYHQGRVRHFLDQLTCGQELDPIEVCHLTPEFFLSDGHHRFAAHFYAGAPTILATYSGREDVLRYLEGRRKTCPVL